ncbi:MAG: DJ-1/PfpI family protein [Planctomycetota bacterium]
MRWASARACVLLLLGGCAAAPERAEPVPDARLVGAAAAPLQVGFLVLDGVYNSELMAPWDVFHHTVFHTQPGMRVFAVGRTKDPVTTFEGLRIAVDYALDEAPPIDVLVVPSAEHNMDSDLDDQRLIRWLTDRGRRAQWLLSVCDGAFLLAEAGLLDDVVCTTFPADIPALRQRYPHLEVHEGLSFVVDGPAITGAGGAKSYDPAMYLVERLYGARVAEGVGKGLVIDWRLADVSHEASTRP